MSMVDFGSKPIYLISDLKNDLFNDLMTQDCLFALVLFKNYVHSIMLGLDAVIIRGNHLNIIPVK